MIVAVFVVVRMRMGPSIRMRVLVPMFVWVRMIVRMCVAMIAVGVVVRVIVNIFDPLVALAATADAAHHTTSISLSRIASPPCTSSLNPPQPGQGAPRAAIGTDVSQSRQ